MKKTFDLLIKDHKKVQVLIDDLLATSPNAKNQRQKLLEELKSELQCHEKIEEDIVYPVLKEKKELKDKTLEGYEEHHVIDVLLAELDALDFKDEMWKAKLTVLKENLQHHIKEEEEIIFPNAIKVLSNKELDTIETEIKHQKIA